MVLQVPLLLCPIFGPMIDCWHQVKLEMLFAVIVLLNTCTVFITKVRLLSFPHLRIYDPNLTQKQFHLDIPLNFIATIDWVQLQHSALEVVMHLFIFWESQQRQHSHVFLCHSSVSFHSVISTRVLIKLSYFIFCISF